MKKIGIIGRGFVGSAVEFGFSAQTGCDAELKVYDKDPAKSIHTLEEIVNESEIPQDFEIQNLNGGILSPGFIDLQVNGGGGKLFNNSPDKESLDTIISAHQYFGTTSIMPTVISDSLNVLQKCTDTISQEIDNNKSLGSNLFFPVNKL